MGQDTIGNDLQGLLSTLQKLGESVSLMEDRYFGKDAGRTVYEWVSETVRQIYRGEVLVVVSSWPRNYLDHGA